MMLYLTEAFRIVYAYLRDVEKLISQKTSVFENHPFPLIDHNPVKAHKQQHRRGSSDHSSPKRPGNNNQKRWAGKSQKSR